MTASLVWSSEQKSWKGCSDSLKGFARIFFDLQKRMPPFKMWNLVSPLKIFELKLVLTILYSINKETVIISITINLRTAIFVWPDFSVLTFNFVLIIQSFWVPTFKNIFIFVSSICVSIASPVKIGFPFRSLEIGIVGLQNKGNPGFDYKKNDKWKI